MNENLPPSSRFGVVVRLVMGLAVAIPLAACTPRGRQVQGVENYPMVRSDLDLEVAQLLMQEYVASAVDLVRSGVDAIVVKTMNEDQRRNLRSFENAAIDGIRRAGLRLQPIPAAYDSWILLEQLEGFVGSEAGAAAFGSHRDSLATMLDRIEVCFHEAIDQIIVDRDAARTGRIATWVEEHPITTVDLSRISPLVVVAEDTDRIGDTFEVLASTQFIANAAYARLHEALISLPDDVRRRLESAIQGVLREPAVAAALIGLARLGDGMKELAAAVEELDRGLEGKLDRLSDGIASEIDRQRQDTIVALQAERVAVSELLLRQEERLVVTLDRQVDAVLKRSEEGLSRVGDRLDRSIRLVALGAALGCGILTLGLIAAGVLAGRGRTSDRLER